MEGLQGIRGAEGGSDIEFRDIPNNLTTNTVHSETPGTMERTELPILLRILQKDGKPLPIGSFTERSVARKVHSLHPAESSENTSKCESNQKIGFKVLTWKSMRKFFFS